MADVDTQGVGAQTNEVTRLSGDVFAAREDVPVFVREAVMVYKEEKVSLGNGGWC